MKEYLLPVLCNIIFLTLIIRGIHSSPTSPKTDGEYCLHEDFEANCLKNEVIVIEEAQYGRMERGRCLADIDDEMLALKRNDPKFFNCFVDVSSQMHEKCTGKQTCKFDIFKDLSKIVENPCRETLSGYLKASYKCIPVLSQDRSCTISATSTIQYLMTSQSSSKLSCGSRHQPWKLEAPAGQQINVNLLDFGGAVNQRDRDCLQYGYIIDREVNKNVSICGSNKETRAIVYSSSSNVLSVTLNHQIEQSTKVFLRIQSVGCIDVVPPEDMWLRRRNQEAVVGCYSSRQTWHLNCVNNHWSGVIGNCTREESPEVKEMPDISNSAVNLEVLVILMIAFVGLILCVLIVVCGIVCLKRYTTKASLCKYTNVIDDKSQKIPGCMNQSLIWNQQHPL